MQATIFTLPFPRYHRTPSRRHNLGERPLPKFAHKLTPYPGCKFYSSELNCRSIDDVTQGVRRVSLDAKEKVPMCPRGWGNKNAERNRFIERPYVWTLCDFPRRFSPHHRLNEDVCLHGLFVHWNEFVLHVLIDWQSLPSKLYTAADG